MTYDKTQKIATVLEDDYTTGCLLDCNFLLDYYMMIEIDLSRQQAFDADPIGIQKINFTGNLKQQATIFFITEETKETVLDFSQ